MAEEQPLKVAVGWTKPPYVISQDNSGFELDLVRIIMAQLGRTSNFMYIPYGRSYRVLKSGKVDIVMTLKPGIDIGDKAMLSDSYVSYQNVLISLKDKNLTVRRLADIGKYSIIGFQKSHLHLGEDYAKATKKSPMFLEMADQRRQVDMLMMGRVDLVVMDINIFNYWLKRDYHTNDLPKIKVHRLFKQNHYRLGFVDSQLKAAFNRALSQYKQTNDYRQLLDKYELQM